jgi:hypothetical protein
MKKLFVVVLAVFFVLSLTAFAQDTSKDAANSQAVQAAAGVKTVSGTIKAEGNKLTFVSDNDQKAWEVQNPETLKGLEGQHVQVQAHVYADKSSIHVMGVEQLKDKGEPNEKKK